MPRDLIAIALLRAEADVVRRALEQFRPQGYERRLVANVLEMLAEPTVSVERVAVMRK